VVRRLVGYDRLEWPALAALERIHELAGDYVNLGMTPFGGHSG